MTQISNAGEVILGDGVASLVYKRQLAASPERVWVAITDPKELKQWYMSETTIDPRLGGKIESISGPSRFQASGAILAWEPPHVFEYEWNVAPRAELPQGEQAVVRYELAAKDGGTHLTMTFTRLSIGTARGFAPGMHAFLDRLEALLAGQPLPDWMTRFGQVQAAYPSWQR